MGFLSRAFTIWLQLRSIHNLSFILDRGSFLIRIVCLLFFVVFIFLSFFHTDLTEKFEYLCDAVLCSITWLRLLINPLVSVLNIPLKLTMVLFDILQNPDTPWVLKHLNIHEVFQ